MCCFVFSRFVNIFVVIVSLKHALHSCISFRNNDESMDQLKDVGIKREEGVMVTGPEDDG